MAFPRRLLIHVVRSLRAYNSLSLTDLMFCTNESLQTALLHLEKHSHEDNDWLSYLRRVDKYALIALKLLLLFAYLRIIF